MLPRIDPGVLAGLSPGRRREVERLLGELEGRRRANPLEFFEPHSVPQRLFFEARTDVVAAFAGNRFGKTTGLVVRAVIESVDGGLLPGRLRRFKRWPGPTFGRIVCPDFTATAQGVILPAFRKWVPVEAFRGGSFDRAWSKEYRQLHFENGSWVQVMTYEQDVDKFGGAALHWVGYDEPPPREIRDECLARLVDFGGYELFAMTPLKANTGWVRRDIYKRRESPEITVIRGSIHDNTTLDAKKKEFFLSSLPSDVWRAAREFGDFVDVGGLIYPDFERAVVDPWPVGVVRSWDPLVSIDPGIRNAAFLWMGFDGDDTCHVFDEALLQDKSAADYAARIWVGNARWGISDELERRRAVRYFRERVTDPGERDRLCRLVDVPRNGEEPLYVIDPASRSRAQVNAESVQSELARFEIFCLDGQNQVEAGISQVRTRIAHRRLLVSRDCVGLRDEADEYAAEDRPDGEFKPIKQNDHRLDALRYGCMARPYDPIFEERAPDRVLGRPVFGSADPARELALEQVPDYGPLGPMS